jgi:hypothetical protein
LSWLCYSLLSDMSLVSCRHWKTWLFQGVSLRTVEGPLALFGRGGVFGRPAERVCIRGMLISDLKSLDAMRSELASC